jgi:hypothetical protein
MQRNRYESSSVGWSVRCQNSDVSRVKNALRVSLGNALLVSLGNVGLEMDGSFVPRSRFGQQPLTGEYQRTHQHSLRSPTINTISVLLHLLSNIFQFRLRSFKVSSHFTNLHSIVSLFLRSPSKRNRQQAWHPRNQTRLPDSDSRKQQWCH